MSSYTIPSVVESSPRGDRIVDVFSRLLTERIILVGTPIDDGVSSVVIAQLLHLAAESSSDVHLYVNSPGGSFSAAMAIYDTMRFVPCDVSTLCVGQAASTAALLVAGGAPGKRALLPHARVVLHQPHADGSRGSLSDLAREAAEIARVRAQSDAILAAHTGKRPEQIRADTDRALVLTGTEAIAYGVADVIVEPDGSGRQQVDAVGALRPAP